MTAFLITACPLATRSAHAATQERRSAATEPHAIEIRLVGGLGEDSVFRERVASWFDADQFDVNVESVKKLDAQRVLTPERGAVVYVWVMLKSPKLARLYFASTPEKGAKTSYLLRDLPLTDGLDEMGAEQIAQALHFSTVALIEGLSASPREEVEESLERETFDAAPAHTALPAKDAAAEEPVAPSREKSNLAFGVGYGAMYRGDEGVQHGPRLRVRMGRKLGVHLRAQGLLPKTQDLGPLAIDVSGATLALAAGMRGTLGTHITLEAFAGAGAEIVHYAPNVSDDSALREGSADTELRPQLIVGAHLGLQQSPRIQVLAELGMNLTETHYDVNENGTNKAIARVPLLIPTLGLELEL